MDTGNIFVVVISGLLLLLVAILFAVHCYQRYLIPNCYVWLKLLSEDEWKQSLQMREEMKAQVGIEGVTLIYSDLEILEDEGLIEGRLCHNHSETYGLYEYKLTRSGGQRKRSIRNRPASRFLFPRTV